MSACRFSAPRRAVCAGGGAPGRGAAPPLIHASSACTPRAHAPARGHKPGAGHEDTTSAPLRLTPPSRQSTIKQKVAEASRAIKRPYFRPRKSGSSPAGHGANHRGTVGVLSTTRATVQAVKAKSRESGIVWTHGELVARESGPTLSKHTGAFCTLPLKRRGAEVGPSCLATSWAEGARAGVTTT